MKGCRECCYAAPTGANLYCSINDCYVGELTCDDFEPIVKAKTNYDRIISKSPEELAEWLAEVLFHCSNTICDERCPMYKCCCDQPSDNIEDWLKQPVEEGGRVMDRVSKAERELVRKMQRQTNADRIRAMTDEELAEWLDDICKSAYDEGYTKETGEPLMSPYPSTPSEWMDWLKQEVNNNSTT